MQKSIDGYVYTPFTNKLCLLLGVSNTICQTLNSNMRATISSLAKISQGKRSVTNISSLQRNIILRILYYEL